MSGRLMSIVWKSGLPHRLKTVAVALAWYGADDGSSIHPSLSTLAQKISLSERRTQAAITDLYARGILSVIRRRSPHRPTEYRLNLEQLPPPAPSIDLPASEFSTGFSTGYPPKNGHNLKFSTVSTGINRTMVSGHDRTVASGRSVQIIKRSSTSTARARGKRKANAQ